MTYYKFLIEFGQEENVQIKTPNRTIFGIVLSHTKWSGKIVKHLEHTQSVIVINTDKDSIHYMQPTAVSYKSISK